MRSKSPAISECRSTRPALSVLLSQLLDLHLSRSIARLKDNPMPDKFEELAAGIEQDLANWDQQATELMAIREQNRQRGERVFAMHRDKQSAVKAGLDRMEKALNSLEGSNSKNGEGSGDSSDSSFQKQ